MALLRKLNRDGKRALPKDVRVGFIRRGWRPFVISADGRPERRAWEVYVLSELRDRLRAGDVWVRGSRRYRNFDECLLPKPTFVALRAEGTLPVGVSEDVGQHLAARQEKLEVAMAEVAALAAADGFGHGVRYAATGSPKPKSASPGLQIVADYGGITAQGLDGTAGYRTNSRRRLAAAQARTARQRHGSSSHS